MPAEMTTSGASLCVAPDSIPTTHQARLLLPRRVGGTPTGDAYLIFATSPASVAPPSPENNSDGAGDATLAVVEVDARHSPGEEGHCSVSPAVDAAAAPMSDPDDWEEYDPSTGSFVHHMIAGSFAGCVEHAGVYPLDFAKTHVQAHRHVTQQMVQQKMMKSSVRQIYRGVSAVLWGCVPAHAMYFSVYEQAKHTLGANRQGHHPLKAATAGALATISHDLVMTPLDVVKQRMQLGLHSSVFSAVRSIVASEGTRALFLSLPTTILMNIPFAATNVAVNESCRRIVNPSGEHNLGAYVFSGAVAGAIAGAVTNPLDVVKTRLQTQAIGCQVEGCRAAAAGVPVPREFSSTSFKVSTSTAGSSSGPSTRPTPTPMGLSPARRFFTKTQARRLPAEVQPASPCVQPYQGLSSAARYVYAEEGLRGFLRGIGPRILTQAPAAALSWGAYESLKHMLNS